MGWGGFDSTNLPQEKMHSGFRLLDHLQLNIGGENGNRCSVSMCVRLPCYYVWSLQGSMWNTQCMRDSCYSIFSHRVSYTSFTAAWSAIHFFSQERWTGLCCRNQPRAIVQVSFAGPMVVLVRRTEMVRKGWPQWAFSICFGCKVPTWNENSKLLSAQLLK